MKKPWYIFTIRIKGWTRLITILNFIIGNTSALHHPHILVHELTHVKRQFMFLGIFWFILYAIPAFRRREELIAFRAEIRHLVENYSYVDYNKYYRQLYRESKKIYYTQIFNSTEEVDKFIEDASDLRGN